VNALEMSGWNEKNNKENEKGQKVDATTVASEGRRAEGKEETSLSLIFDFVVLTHSRAD
jgi:hypothetical protein